MTNDQPLVPSWQGSYPPQDFPDVFAIGLGGLAQCGKTTVGTEVINQIAADPNAPAVTRGSFSARIKQVAAALVGQESTFNDQEDKRTQLYGASDWTVRDFLMAFGTGLVRDQIGPDFWVDVVAKQMTQVSQPTILVFDDMRFPNEVGLIRSLGIAVLIERPGVEKVFTHASENPESLGVKTTILNDSTPQEAAAKVLALAKDHDLWPTKDGK